MNKGYAYLDTHGILHVTHSVETARRFGKYEVVNFDYDHGYPQIVVNGKRVPLVVYTNPEVKSKHDDRPIPPYVKELVERLK